MEWYNKALRNGLIAAQADVARVQANLPAYHRMRSIASELFSTGYLALRKDKCSANSPHSWKTCETLAKDIPALNDLADGGLISAQLLLAGIYAGGRDAYSSLQDWKKTVYWLEMAASRDDVAAQFYLGEMYNEDLSTTKNPTAAENYYRAAIAPRADRLPDDSAAKVYNHNYEWIVEHARERLIQMHYSPVPKANAERTKSMGRRWHDIYQQLFAAAEKMLWDECATLRNSGQIAMASAAPFASSDLRSRLCGVRMGWDHESQLLADGSLQALAEQDLLAAQVLLGVGLVSGDRRGDWAESQTAADWFEQAAKHGNDIASFALGFIYEYGLGVNADNTIAEHWYRAAQKPRSPGKAYLDPTLINIALARISKKTAPDGNLEQSR